LGRGYGGVGNGRDQGCRGRGSWAEGVERLGHDATIPVVWVRLNTSSRTKETTRERQEARDRREEKGSSFS